ncbi:type I-MYXAN CRISPR-associated Cas8a1/Cmx1 [Thalassoglobus polymorphus]|uniref:CRISPR-associated protein Cas8a1/Csx13 n=1 Tax=Thalassoglobus polymorphus TaxID=2527994 RepID=A0A517QKX9_9PLAN|nr:type I-MYXAN CRISPR-associated Cas8a1/Cmx1 [Thalassoglobus polymorphus]QDT32299.1 CRISPR-associated protein Cas8a1/Csx13 [Thalassoglobus polymorphus]
MAKKKIKKEPEHRLKNGLTWNLHDPGMGMLERAGLAALYMSLRAAEELGVSKDLEPLFWNDDDLTPESVTIRTQTTDAEALQKLFEWAWQARDGVLYLPAIHRTLKDRDNLHLRVDHHNGILNTFLQHKTSRLGSGQKTQVVHTIVMLDEDQSIEISYQNLCFVKAHEDAKEIVDANGCLKAKARLSSWVNPGSANRYPTDASSWKLKPCRGLSTIAVLWMLTPISCVFNRFHKERTAWSIIIPDVRDLEEFEQGRLSPFVSSDLRQSEVASLSDAGLRFLSTYATQTTRNELESGCRVIAMGKVGYYQSQSIRKGVVDVPANARTIRRYRILTKHLGNSWIRRSHEETKSSKKKKSDDEPQASGFLSVPTVRGRITDNLIKSHPWYVDLTVPPQWDRGALDRQRKRQPGKSVERLWFNNLQRYQRKALMELIREDDMWDDPSDREFIEAFWETLAALYYREKEAVDRGGSRSWSDRIEDLNEDIRREITRAKTGSLLRQTLTELFSRPVKKFRSAHVRNNPGLIWKLIDRDWKRGRDLALLALASYQSKEKRETSQSTETQTATSNS